MYHEEQVIDGILHWRGTPNGQWYPYTAQQLTERIVAEKPQPDEDGWIEHNGIGMPCSPYECVDIIDQRGDEIGYDGWRTAGIWRILSDSWDWSSSSHWKIKKWRPAR